MELFPPRKIAGDLTPFRGRLHDILAWWLVKFDELLLETLFFLLIRRVVRFQLSFFEKYQIT